MKYWGYFLGKLAVAAVIMAALRYSITMLFPPKAIIFYTPTPLFAHDLGYTTAMMVYFLCCFGLVQVIIWDQRYRCRTCLRRLRMPVSAGSWPNMFLIGVPRTEYICPFGHGTLKVPQVRIAGPNASDWTPHDDIWKELESLRGK